MLSPFDAPVAVANVDPITCNDATAERLGFTREVFIEGGDMGGLFRIKPDTDLDGRFKAWAVDWQEWAFVNGWSVLIEDAE